MDSIARPNIPCYNHSHTHRATLTTTAQEIEAMIKKRILNSERLRRIQSGFAFIEHRFLTGGFLASMSRAELLLYFFLVLAADRNGVSFYCYDSICNLVGLDLSEYLEARVGLIEKVIQVIAASSSVDSSSISVLTGTILSTLCTFEPTNTKPLSRSPSAALVSASAMQ